MKESFKIFENIFLLKFLLKDFLLKNQTHRSEKPKNRSKISKY